MIKKLRWKFICFNMLIVVIMLSFILGFVIISTRKSFERDSMNMMKIVSSEPSHRHHPGPGTPEEGVRLPYFTLRSDEDGQLLAEGNYFDLTDQEYLEELFQTAENSEAPNGILKESNLRYLRQDTPAGTVIVFADISAEKNAVSEITRSSLLIGGAAFLAFLGISILLARWAIRPVEEAWENQKQFISDASHDLRTPLTVIMTDAEMLPDSPQSQGIRKMASQMRGLIDNMLTLARIDAGSSPSDFEVLDLCQLLTEESLPYEPLFYENNLTLSEDLTPGISVFGSREQLSRLLSILLDNARKYSSPGTETVLRLSSAGKYCILAVSDCGSEIPHEDLTKIFRRFYRSDESRSNGESYGLGLSIAEGIVQSHKGQIWAESENGVATFYVKLPQV